MTTAFVDRAIAALRSPGTGTFVTLAAVLAASVVAGWFFQRQFRRAEEERAREATSATADAG
jgi:hypothetical protein